MPSCWTDLKQRGENGQNIGNVTRSAQNMEDKPWKNEELKKIGGGPAKAKRERSGEGVEIVQGENRSGMRRLPPKKSPWISGFDKETKREKWWNSWRRWNKVKKAATKRARLSSS